MKKTNVDINVTKTAEDIFEVKSHTSTTKYEINIKSGSCTCPHYRFRLAKSGGHCKHYIDVTLYLKQITENNADLFADVKKYVTEHNNRCDINLLAEKFGDDTIDEMVRLQMLFKWTPSKLGVLE